jgi:hypothetical protein
MNRIVALAILAAFGATACAQAPAGEITMEMIRKKWQERQDKVKSLKCEIDAKEIIHKGSGNALLAFLKSADEIREPSPKNDVTVTGNKKLSLGVGGEMRYECHVPIWDATANTLVPLVRIDTHDGKEHRAVNNRSSLQSNYATGDIATRERSQSSSLLGLYPVLHFCRACEKKYVYASEHFELGRRSLTVLNRPVVELVRESKPTKQLEALFLDAERDYILVRRTLDVAGKRAIQLDVQYEKNPQHGWIPARWEYIFKSGQENLPVHSGTATVVNWELESVVDSSEFSLRFPPGTLVTDASGTKEVRFVVQPDGSAGKRIPSTSMTSYEELNKADGVNIFGHPATPYLLGLLFLVIAASVARRTFFRRH